jgi:hypothetical protein
MGDAPRTLRLALALGLLLPGVPGARAEGKGMGAPIPGDDGKATALHVEYETLFREKDARKARRRLEILRDLGNLPCPVARFSLLRTLPVARTLDEKVIAVLSLGKVGDATVVPALAAAVAKEDHPVLWQALSDGLARLPDRDAGTWIATAGIDGAKGPLLAALVRAAGHLQMKEAAPRIAALYRESAGRKDGVDLCHDAAAALGEIGGPSALPVLREAAGHPDWRVRLAAAEALPRLPDREKGALEAFRRALEGGNDVVRRIGAVAAGERKWEEAVPLLAAVLADERLAVRKAAHGALAAIAGKDLGFEPATWLRWWKDRAEGTPDVYTVGEWHGHRLWSDRAVFVVDTSGSMAWPWRKEPKRIEVARAELARVLGTLREATLFNVVAFANRVRPWQAGGEVPATEANVALARRWLERSFEADGDTWTHAALREAFARNPEFDALYFLSDGAPSHGDLVTPEGIVAQVKVWNRYRRAVVHTVGLTLEDMDRGMPNLAEDLREMRGFLRDLAAATGGESRIVTRAPKQ